MFAVILITSPNTIFVNDLFRVIHCHAERWVLGRLVTDDKGNRVPVKGYYPSDAERRKDPDDFKEICSWLDELNDLIPNGVGVSRENLTVENLARLIAKIIYLVSAEHEMVGTHLWNYQLWTHRQPVRVYRDGQREPLDVYQRLVNNNYIQNVKRTKLMDTSTYDHVVKGLPVVKELPVVKALPSEQDARLIFNQFVRDLEGLDRDMREEVWQVWKIYPDMLESHINA